MAPRRKNASIKSTGSTSSKAEPLPDWVKNKNIAKPPPRHVQEQQQQQQQQQAGPKDISSPNGGHTAISKPPPLFPPGTKTPINLLNERIQKHHSSMGWLKPIIEARKLNKASPTDDADAESERWTFVVTLTKTNKADQSNPFAVRFDARDPSGLEGSAVAMTSKEEAKHWGATYALFRLCSNLSLYQVLPAGPREYWKKLSTHKSSAPEHLTWLWASDPFEAAQKVAAEKEMKNKAKAKLGEEVDRGPRLSRTWQDAREVRMAKDLRDAVEATVKKALETYPSDIGRYEALQGGSTPTYTDREAVISSLLKLGFRRGHATSAYEWLLQARQGQSTSSASLASIAHLSNLDACLEYLVIFCPEEDLPARFAPSTKADSFVTSSAAAGKEETLAVRWIEDRLVKVAGYPRTAVSKTLASLTHHAIYDREAICVNSLLFQLCESEAPEASDAEQEARLQLRGDERMTLEAVLGPERIIEISPSERPLNNPLTSATDLYDIVITRTPEEIRLRLCPGLMSMYPTEGDKRAVPSFFVASTTLPAYLRLALTRRLGRCLLGQETGYEDWSEIIQAGQGGVLLSLVGELESCWQVIVDQPPELAVVMKGVTPLNAPAKDEPAENVEQRSLQSTSSRSTTVRPRPRPQIVRDLKVDVQLKEAQVRLWQSASYQKLGQVRNALPARASKNTILSLLETNRVLIIAGETGCGKTTQCPQFILESLIEQGCGSLCNIIVTQPRRLSAMGVASRVATERCEDLDGKGLVGYAIRGERRVGRQTRLLFSTTGVLLRRLSQHDRDLEGISHIFVDEVHERGVESDLLLLELREVLKRNPSLRVILMSATIDRETFSAYFGSAPVISIPGRTHPVSDMYLEDIQDISAHVTEGRGERRMSGIDYELLAATTKMVCHRAVNKGDHDGAILIFCPGVGEIRLAMEAVQRELRGEVEILALHANLTPEEQRKVFSRTKARKVVISTNVAETSITIDDIVYVIDTGLVKETRYDPISGLTRLVETRCSRAAARQRRGRAGRVRPGECFKLYSRGTEEHKMVAQQVPEIKRMALENLLLTVKALKGESADVKEYLAKAISPPTLEAIDKALVVLDEMNIAQGGTLTALGKHVSLLPLDVRLAKLLVLGCVFHCLESVLTIAAIMSAKPLFSGPYEKRGEVSTARAKFLIGSSDILTDVNAFQQWNARQRERGNAPDTRRWCEDNFLSQSSLRDIASTRVDLLGNLIELGFVPFEYSKGGAVFFDANDHDVNLKRSLLFAGLYPSVVRIAHPRARYDQFSSGTVQRESEAREVRFFDAQRQRVFLHPSSTLFSNKKYQSDFLTFFAKSVAKSNGSESGEKIYLRDGNEVPIFAMLLFGGKMKVHRLQGGISMSCAYDQDEGWIKLRASARIATLVQHLRLLLDAALEKSFEDPSANVFERGLEAEVRDCLQRVLDKDGLS